MRTLVLVALTAFGWSLAAASTAHAVPDYIKRYWEARQPHTGSADQPVPATPPPALPN
jgi:hypothetical protein